MSRNETYSVDKRNGRRGNKVVPDQVSILASVETKGTDAKEVKKQNNQQMETVLKLDKSMNLAPVDYKKRVSLNP